MTDGLHIIAAEHNEVVRIERLTHHIKRIREGMDEMRRGQNELKASMAKLADALTRLALVEERQASASTALERLADSIEKLDNRLRTLEVSEPVKARSAEWVMSAVWASASSAVVFVAGKAGLFNWGPHGRIPRATENPWRAAGRAAQPPGLHGTGLGRAVQWPHAHQHAAGGSRLPV